ncbi:MAG: CDP-alcohol phosphatidyltransferase family protein [Candidatus Thorarchaeota archaeon]|nr:MAG: CDP-alcohol phosphatidyltransferase family protein [Candidatus Thorarchaeota archaeon]
MLGRLRERYQAMMMPIGRVIAKTGITPNAISVLTLAIAILTAWFFYFGDLLLGLLTMVFTVILDMFDGAVARANNMSSPFGATLDHTLDRYAEFLFLFGLMLGPAASLQKFLHWVWGYFALFGMVMASFTRAKAESVGGMDDCSVGIAERQEKLILTFVGILLLMVDPVDGWMGYSASVPVFMIDVLSITNILTLCVVIVGLLSHITVIQRLLYARKVIGEPRSDSVDNV